MGLSPLFKFKRRDIKINYRLKALYKIILALAALYTFLFSIKLMGESFGLMGESFAHRLISVTSNPFTGLFIGIVTTSIIQSSSVTTSSVVGLVAANTLSLSNAIPIIMGANIGTTITNAIVSLAHINRREEFRRAFAGSIIHDIFNVLTVIILFPLEIRFHILEKLSVFMASIFIGIGGAIVFNPLKLIMDPAINIAIRLIHSPAIMALVSLFLLFSSLVCLVKIIRSLVITKMKILLDYYLFKNDKTSFFIGAAFTTAVQSSSVTTSIVVPLVGSGLLTIKQVFPYTLGANIGTTTTAILASLATSSPVAIAVAFSHLLFNVIGIIIIYPFRKFPIWIAESFSNLASRSKRNTIIFLMIYFLLYFIPLVLILF